MKEFQGKSPGQFRVFQSDWLPCDSGRNEADLEAALLITNGEQDGTDVSRLDGKFFVKLALQSVFQAFACIDFSSWEFP